MYDAELGVGVRVDVGFVVGVGVAVAFGVAVVFSVAIAFGVAVALIVGVAVTIGVGVEVFGVVTAKTTHPNVKSRNNATIPTTIIFVDIPNAIDFYLSTSAVIASLFSPQSVLEK